MDTLKIMGQRIQALRKERKLKQSELAEVLDITHNHYQKIEYGQINIPTLTLCALADYFGVSVDYLLGRSESRQPGRPAP